MAHYTLYSHSTLYEDKETDRFVRSTGVISKRGPISRGRISMQVGKFKRINVHEVDQRGEEEEVRGRGNEKERGD